MIIIFCYKQMYADASAAEEAQARQELIGEKQQQQQPRLHVSLEKLDSGRPYLF